jgi:hypothetical protein
MKPMLTATQGTNADLFPSALALYAKETGIADAFASQWG